MDFGRACPSMWRQVGEGLCEAPSNYAGVCNKQVDTSGMTEKDKSVFGTKCGARWPCLSPPAHLYADLCPQGWTLQFGQICHAPDTYTGPCDHVAYMTGMSVGEKKIYEAACSVSWPDAPMECEHDYTAPCPFGWLKLAQKTGIECRAPPMYGDCNRIQQFTGMTPAEKQDWAQSCKQNFPCRDRSGCTLAWDSPCPAGWYAFNGGHSCLAPEAYSGKCSSVLHGLIELSRTDKELIAKTCGLAWPCEGEIAKTFNVAPGLAMIRSLSDPAAFSLTNGAIEASSGAVIS